MAVDGQFLKQELTAEAAMVFHFYASTLSTTVQLSLHTYAWGWERCRALFRNTTRLASNLAPKTWAHSKGSLFPIKTKMLSPKSKWQHAHMWSHAHLFNAQSFLMHVAQVKHGLCAVLLLRREAVVDKRSLVIHIRAEAIEVVVSKLDSSHSIAWNSG